jgi:hypothetical protein
MQHERIHHKRRKGHSKKSRIEASSSFIESVVGEDSKKPTNRLRFMG